MKKIKSNLMKNVSLAVATICTVQFSVAGIASAQAATPQPLAAYSVVAAASSNSSDLKASTYSHNVPIGETVTIRLTYNGSSLNNSNVDWDIGNTSIATVDNGVVKAKKTGSTYVTARYNGEKVSIRITVTKAETLEASKSSVTLKKGKKSSITLKFAGKSVRAVEATWKSSDRSVATVDDGEIKAVSNGTATITASYRGQTVEIRVHVEDGNSDGKLEANVSKIYLDRGDKETIKLTYDDDRLTASKASWRTSKSSVATVNDDGVVTAKGKGTATITAKYKGYEVEVEVFVDTDASGRLEADDTNISLKSGERDTIQLRYDNDRLSGSSATWKTSDSYVATVSDGVITARNKGTATITAEYRGYKVEIQVKVDANTSGKLVANDTSISLKKGERDIVILAYDGRVISNSDANWRTSRSSVATVSSNGTITAQGKGTATITAEYRGEKVEIDVKVDGSGLLEAGDTSISMDKGDREIVTLKYDGDYLSGSKAKWKTSKSSVATVSSSGTITAKGKGKATITAEYRGEKVEIEVEVGGSSSDKLEAEDDEITIKKGKSEKIRLTYDGDDLSGSKATWSTSKSSVATVSDSGTVKAKKKGKATITAKYRGYKVEIEVTVK